VKNLIVYIGIGLIRLVSFLPLPAAQALGAAIGKMMWFTDASRIAKINLRICYPEYSEAKIEQLARESLIALGKTFGEMGMSWMWPIPKVQKLIERVDGLEHLEKALEEKQGIILIAPHLGNWEVLNHFFRQYLFMTIMYKPAKIPALDNFIFSTRKRVDVDLVPADRSGVESLYKTLNEKGVIAVLPDQEPGLKSGVFAPFFGQMALTGKLIGELANNTSATLLCCYAKRLADGSYGVVIRPASKQIRNTDEVAAATALNASIEECVNDCPEQYQWNYKRFRRQPEGRSNFYKK
jgi:KDO2-lipid IV(A) lauroyltransferase